MKRVTWIRHAKSSWANEGLEDHARPLNDRGLGNAAEMGRRLAARKVHPDLLLSSSALRAMGTAHIIAEALGRDPDSVQCEKRLYLASVAEMLDVLADVPGEVDHVMLFWHNPGITEAVEILLDLRDLFGVAPPDKEKSTSSLLEKAQQLRNLTRLR